MSTFTPGPWFADADGNIWRRPIGDLYQNGGAVAGDRPLACAYRGWQSDGYPAEANARLMAAAPELLEALQGSRRFVAFAFDQGIAGAEEAGLALDAAIAAATGGQP